MEVEKKLINKPIDKKPLELKAYKRRWWIIFVFICYSGFNSLQWIEYSSITQIVVKYYQVSSLAVDWTSTIYMAVYPPLVVPAMYFIEKKGIRLAAITGATLNFIGTAIKLLSIKTSHFWVVLLGNFITSLASLLIASLPPKLAAIWFKPNEVSTACSLGMFGIQIGCAIGYILPPLLVKNHSNIEEIGRELNVLCWALTVSLAPITAAVFVYFPDEPPLPASNTQAMLRENKEPFETKLFFKSVKKLFKNKPFLLHIAAYSIIIAVFSAVGTLLTQLITQHFENADEEAGWMGFLLIIFGLVGMLVFGIILDKTKKFKETAVLVYFCSAISVVALMFTLKYKLKIMTYIACIALGIFSNAYMPIGFEIAMELTFPAEEATTTGLLLAVCQLLGVVFVVGVGFINIWFGGFWVLSTQALALLIGTAVTAFVPNIKLRQDAFNQDSANNVIKKASLRGSKIIFIE